MDADSRMKRKFVGVVFVIADCLLESSSLDYLINHERDPSIFRASGQAPDTKIFLLNLKNNKFR
jgi:hypothetical protein